jgi:hypothetical protein
MLKAFSVCGRTGANAADFALQHAAATLTDDQLLPRAQVHALKTNPRPAVLRPKARPWRFAPTPTNHKPKSSSAQNLTNS